LKKKETTAPHKAVVFFISKTTLALTRQVVFILRYRLSFPFFSKTTAPHKAVCFCSSISFLKKNSPRQWLSSLFIKETTAPHKAVCFLVEQLPLKICSFRNPP
jgi:hypothetical protein